MLELKMTSKFKKDLKVIRKRNYPIHKLDKVLQLLQMDIPLPSEYKDHPLIGNYVGHRECHISPDWLLIYRKSKDGLILVAARTGTHSDVF